MPVSAVVGTACKTGTRSGAMTARARRRPPFTCGMVAGTVEVTMSTSPLSMAVRAIVFAFGVGLVAGQGQATRSVMRLVLQKQPARSGEL